MPNSSARKRPNPSGSQSGRKRRPVVNFEPSLEAGPSGTGHTDTRMRSPERPSFALHATLPRSIGVLKDKENKNFFKDLQHKKWVMMDRDGLTEQEAMRHVKREWTNYIVETYGDIRVSTAEGIVSIEHVGDTAGHEGGECGEPTEIHVDDEGDDRALLVTSPKKRVLSAKEAQTLFAKDSQDDQKVNDEKDDYICQEIFELIASIKEFAEDFARHEVNTAPAKFMHELLVKENAQLVRYIGCLAIGGKNGVKGWGDLLTKPDKREALVVGILGRALKEHVFSDLLFGATLQQKADLQKEEKPASLGDGFSRTEARAKKAKQYVGKKDKASLGELQREVSLMTARLEKLLAPFLNVKSKKLPANMHSNLTAIVQKAADLSRLMRLAPDVIYYWSSTFKDEEFDPMRMECYNLEHMIHNSPYERKVIQGIERPIPRESSKPDEREAIVKIVCFPGLVAYRKYGGELAKKEIERETARPDHRPADVRNAARRVGEDDKNTSKGYRSRTICKSIVYLIWGKQRLLTREAGTSAHIDAVRDGNMDKYVNDYEGFLELFDIAQQKWEKARIAEKPASTSPRRFGGLFGVD